MRVAFDGRPAHVAMGSGIGTYTKSLLKALARLDRRTEYAVAWPRGEAFNLTRSRRFSTVSLSRHPRPDEDSLWLAATPADLYHLPQNGFNLPALPAKMGLVVTVHDLIPFLLPETVRSGYLRKFLREVPRAVASADRVITVSQCTADALTALLGVEADRIRIIPNAPDRGLRPLPPAECREAVRKRFGLTEPYILHVGGTNARKNLETLVFAFSRVNRALSGQPTLAIAGDDAPDGSLSSLIRALRLNGEVRLLGFVPEKELPHLYGAAGLFVYPSLYEGFGIPPLEAMACGVPVITANNSALPEVVGDAAVTVDPQDATRLSQAITDVWESASLRQALSERGLARAAEYSWTRAAQATLDVYSEVAAMRRPTDTT